MLERVQCYIRGQCDADGPDVNLYRIRGRQRDSVARHFKRKVERRIEG